MTYYKKHVFFCTNQRLDGKQCCEDANASHMRQYAKKKLRAKQLDGPGGVRINAAGCLDRCAEGPVLVIYPEAVWYTFDDEHDVDEIIEKHIENDQIVERLLVDPLSHESSAC